MLSLRLHCGDRGRDWLHALGNPPVIVLSKLLQADNASGRHRYGGVATSDGVAELPRAFLQLGLRCIAVAVLGMVVPPHLPDGAIDHLGRDFQAAVNGAAQCLGLHDAQAQIAVSRFGDI